MKKAFVYSRVSTDEQAEEGKSIETQIKLANKWAKENGYTVLETFTDEGKSATSLNRPALQDMLSKCSEKGIVDAIIVQDTDRLARNTLDHLTLKSILKKKEIKVVSISQPMIDDSPEGNLIDTIIASVNAFQSQITGRKTSKVLEEKAKLGWYPGGTPPLGYKNSINTAPSSTLDQNIVVPDIETSKYIREGFVMYSTGNHTTQDVTDYLNKNFVLSAMKKKLGKSSVHAMLKNQFYIGKFLWNGTEYTGKHELFISHDIFDRVQSMLEIKNKKANRKRKHQFLLNGFIFDCQTGARMHSEKHTKKSGKVYEYYFSPDSPDSYVEAQLLEEQVELLFREIQISKEYTIKVMELAKKILKENRDSQDSVKKRLFADKRKIEEGMKEAENSRFIERTLNDDSFQRIYKRFEQQLQDINSELANTQRDHSDKIHQLENILRLAENIGVAYIKADYLQKKEYLYLFFTKIYVQKGKVKGYELTNSVKTLIEEGSVQIRPTGLPRLDSNQGP